MSTDDLDKQRRRPSGDRDDGRRVDNRTLWEQVRDRLREDILSGELAPGSVLSEAALAELVRGQPRARSARRSGGSRARAWSTITPRRGAIVTELTPDEFVDAYQLREALETLAIAARGAPARAGATWLGFASCTVRWPRTSSATR